MINKKHSWSLLLVVAALVVVFSYQNCQRATYDMKVVINPGDVDSGNGLLGDSSIPVVTLTSIPDALSIQSSEVITFDVVDYGDSGEISTEGLTFRCTLDERSIPCSVSSVTLEDLSDGPHTFEVMATDRAGNTSIPGVVKWMTDRTPPVIKFLEPLPPVQTDQRTVRVNFEATDSGSGFKEYSCTLNGIGREECSPVQTFEMLEDGRYEFQVSAIDRLGNRSNSISIRWEVKGINLTLPTILGVTSVPKGNVPGDVSIDDFLGLHPEPSIHFGEVAGAELYEVEVLNENGTVSFGKANSSNAEPVNFPSLQLEHGKYYLAKVSASNGLQRTSVTRKFFVDLKGPRISFTLPVIEAGVKALQLRVRSVDSSPESGVESTTCEVTSFGAPSLVKSEASCTPRGVSTTFELELKDLPFGRHVLRAQSKDRVGNISEAQVEFFTSALICDGFSGPSPSQCHSQSHPIVGNLYYVTPFERANFGGQHQEIRKSYHSLYQIVGQNNERVKKSEITFRFSEINQAPGPWLTGFVLPNGQKVAMDDGSTLFEFFGLRLTGSIGLTLEDEPGLYEFAIVSDDGFSFQLDGKTVIEHLPSTPPRAFFQPEKALRFEFGRGIRKNFQLDWFQGPRKEIALQLFWRVKLQNSKVNCPAPGVKVTSPQRGCWQLVKPGNFQTIFNQGD